jgi:hypothetical protein
MLIVPRAQLTSWVGFRGLRLLLGTIGAAALFGAACSEEDDVSPPAAVCTASSGGPVAGPASTHCVADDGSPIVQTIGACLSGAEAAEEEHEHEGDAGEEHEHEGDAGEEHEHEGDAGEEHEHDEGEEHEPNFGNAADDDDCKYRVSFTNSCVGVNQPVTFTLSLTRKFDNQPGSGTNPAFPEVFLESDPTHISPSNDITATEGPDGTYAIGPIVFDVPGRWVIRYHYFETCSDVAEDSPHGHAAFYIDVPAPAVAPAARPAY